MSNETTREPVAGAAAGCATEVRERELVVSVLIGVVQGKERWGGNFSCESFGEAKSLLNECAKDDPRPWRIVAVDRVTRTQTVYESHNDKMSGRAQQNTNNTETK